MLLIGIHCCKVIKLCPVQSTQVLVVALRDTPLACTIECKSSAKNICKIYLPGKHLPPQTEQ